MSQYIRVDVLKILTEMENAAMVGKNSSVGFVIPKQEASDLSISLIVRITNTNSSKKKTIK